MTNEEAIELLIPLTDYKIQNGIGSFPMVYKPEQVEALRFAIKALKLEQQNHGIRLIDGNRLKEYLFENFDGIQCYDGTGFDIYKECEQIIDEMPTLRQEGEWEDYSIDFYKCPECGYLLNKLCPQCYNEVILPIKDMKGEDHG